MAKRWLALWALLGAVGAGAQTAEEEELALAYGSKGAGASIPANAPLVFVVDLLGV